MGEIDKVIDAHGGWLDVFLGKNKEALTQVEANVEKF
jgi:hypothetical protein